MTRRFIAIFALCVLVTFIAIGFYRIHFSGQPSRVENSLGAQQSYWEKEIARVGGVAAYREYASSVASSSPEVQHTGAHVFGAALYRSEGIAGLSVCDNRFSYGCFHEFLGRAIADRGLSSIPKLNEVCTKALSTSPLSCEHGIGHGVLASLGYNESDLNRALGICHTLPYNDPIGGCYGGVFMEYNMQLMLGTQAQLRPATSDLHAPCDRVAPEFQGSCYFAQSQWVSALLLGQHASPQEATLKAGKLCDGLVDQEFARDCFEGLGTNVPASVMYDVAQTIQLCNASTQNPLHQLFCRSYAANSFFGADMNSTRSLLLCAGLKNAAYSYCAAYARNDANLALPAAVPPEM
jgi:hypothetical protein